MVQYCRVCYTNTTHITSLFRRDADTITYYTKLQQIVPHLMKFEETASFPVAICRPCIEDLRVAYRFHTRCTETYNQLMMRQQCAPTPHPTTPPQQCAVRLLKCPHCGKLFTMYALYECHLKVAHNTTTDMTAAKSHVQTVKVPAKQLDGVLIKPPPPPPPPTPPTTNLNNNNENARKVKLYQCAYCMKYISSVTTLKSHLKVYHQKDIDKMQAISTKRIVYCGGGGNTNVNNNNNNNVENEDDVITERYVNEHAHVRYKCMYCGIVFEKGDSIKTHMEEHEANLKCTLCAESFGTRQQMIHHLVTHSRKQECTYCGLLFAQKIQLVQHVRTHHTEEKAPYSCDVCYERFGRADLLAHHKCHPSSVICQVCDLELSSAERLKFHMRVHSGPNPYICDYCGRSCINKEHLKQHYGGAHAHDTNIQRCNVCCVKFDGGEAFDAHVRSVHDDPDVKPSCSKTKSDGCGKFVCDVCGKMYRTRVRLMVHRRGHTTERNWKCPECEYAAKTKAALKRHRIVHTDDKPYACTVCQMRFNVRPNLVRHMLIHTGEKPFECDICHHRCRQKVSLAAHMMKHTDERPHQCETCGKTFRTATNLRLHSVQHLDAEQRKELKSRRPNAPIYTCEYCNTSFGFKFNYLIHVRRHTGEKPFKCDQCDYAAISKHQLQIHHRTHTGERPYVCEVCGAAFGFRGNYLRHLSIHSGQKPFQCTVCKFRARQKTALEQHMNQHVAEKPYACDQCEKKFAFKISLYQHKRIHKGRKYKVYACELCTFTTRDRRRAERHMETAHSNDYQTIQIVTTETDLIEPIQDGDYIEFYETLPTMLVEGEDTTADAQ